MENRVLETDNGIIAVALQLYSDWVITNGSNIALSDRAGELAIKYRNLLEVESNER